MGLLMELEGGGGEGSSGACLRRVSWRPCSLTSLKGSEIFNIRAVAQDDTCNSYGECSLNYRIWYLILENTVLNTMKITVQVLLSKMFFFLPLVPHSPLFVLERK